MSLSVFSKYYKESYPYKFEGTLLVKRIMGGIPRDPRVAEAWLKTKLGADKDDQIRAMVAEIMLEQNLSVEKATEEANKRKNLNGFRRDIDTGQLFIEGRQLKAALKEAASVAVGAGKLDGRGWGKTNKGILGFLSEHLFVLEDRLPLFVDGQPVMEPTGIVQNFVHTFRGSGIQYKEYVENAEIHFSLVADYSFKEKDWAIIWTTGEFQGIGASRSQGDGVYQVIKWEDVS